MLFLSIILGPVGLKSIRICLKHVPQFALRFILIVSALGKLIPAQTVPLVSHWSSPPD